MTEFACTASTLSSHTTADSRKRLNSLLWGIWFLIVLISSTLFGLAMVSLSPKPAFIGWMVFLLGIALILYQPRYGVFLIIFLSLVGDKGLIYWYPFHLNFSSNESLLYLDHRLIFSPMEIYLVTTFFSWFVRKAILRKLQFSKGELFWPVMIFIAFVFFGLFYGFSRGGNINIGLWEARAIFYLPAMLILVTNHITKREHVCVLIWLIVSALFIEGLIGVEYYFTTMRFNPAIDAAVIMEHSAAIQMNTFFIFMLSLWLYRGSSKSRIIMLVMAIPILFTFFMIQRRAAFLALLIALVFVAFILYKENRFVFWIIVPSLTILMTAYLIVFWNHQGSLGFLAQAIKSQIAPWQASLRDQYSDLYRVIENFNIYYTIQQAPITGIGFGHMFTMAIPLPDISFFVWWRYITHNSIGWIWMKTGIGGFIAMLFLVGLSLMTGVRTLFRMPGGVLSAVILTGTLYILMHFIFAYADMAWDNQSMTYLGTMMGLIGCAESIVAKMEVSSAARGKILLKHIL